MPHLELIATAAFGLEAVVSRELKQLGYEEQTVEDGRVSFTGDERAICRANLWLRSADRVLLKLGEFEARDFGQLFDKTKALPWEDWLTEDAAFPVRGRSVRSQLSSVPDCQSIVKKAVVEKLKTVHHRDWFDETGANRSIEVSLLKDRATLTIDTTGPSLHKRGYRTLVGSAPLKETLAAGPVQLSFWNASRPLVDPFCGSGTIPIEAALLGRNLAPGLGRSFAAEAWPNISPRSWQDAREEAHDLQHNSIEGSIIGTDADENVLKLARQHARAAGVADDLHLQQQPIAEFTTRRTYGCAICNPPYGQRIGKRDDVEALYREMARVFAPLETWSIYVLTAFPGFEKIFGRKASKRRKLYNGRIECTYYQYFGPRPPRSPSVQRAEPGASSEH